MRNLTRLHVLAGALLVVTPTAAQTQRLNGELLHYSGRVDRFVVAPAGNRVLYLGSPDGFPEDGLYAAPADGSAAATMLRERDVSDDFQLGPDGLVAVYRAHPSVSSPRFLLYARATDGSGPELLLSQGMLLTANVGSPSSTLQKFSVSPDWTRVVYAADALVDERYDLFSAPLDGSAAPVRISADLAPGADVGRWRISDGGFVVYSTGLSGTNHVTLHAVPVDGGAPAVPLAAAEFLWDWALSPDGARVAFQINHALYAVAADGGSPAYALGASWQEEALIHRFTPDGSRIVYRADQDTADVLELYSVPSDASAPPVRLSDGGPDADVEEDFAVAADGSCVVYRSDSGQEGVLELFAADVAGSGAPLLLSGAASGVSAFALAADGRVVFRADPTSSGLEELYSVPLTGGAPVRLHASRAPHGFVSELALDPDGLNVVFAGHVPGDQAWSLHSAPTDGSAPSVALPALSFLEPLGALAVDCDGRVVHRASRGAMGERERLLSVALDGSQAPVQLADVIDGGTAGRVEGFHLEPRGGHALYTAKEAAPYAELYRVDARGGVPSERLSHHDRVLEYVADEERAVYTTFRSVRTELWSVPLEGGPEVRLDREHDAWHLYVAPQGGRAAFVSGGSARDLYGVPIDGSAPAALLSDPDMYVHTFEASPDGERLAFLANLPGAPAQLYAVPIVGGAPPVLLTPAGYEVVWIDFFASDAFEISPDGSRVVFVARSIALDQLQLLSAPLAGGPATELSDPMIPQGEVGGGPLNTYDVPFRISPDGARVVFIATARFSSRAELFSVPIGGAATRVVIGPVGTPNGDVWEYEISPDSSRVVYRANDEAIVPFELRSVPIAGGPVLQLNDPLDSVRSVESIEGISPDSRWVLYRADQRVDEEVELFAVPIDRSRPPVCLNAPLGATDVGAGARITSDGGSVLFLDTDWRLFEAPIDGHAAAALLAPLVPGDHVFTFEPTFDSRRVLYMQQRQTSGVHDLYSTKLVYGPSKLRGRAR